MDVNGSRTIIMSAQGVMHTRSGDQFALSRLWPKGFTGNRDNAPQCNPMLVLKHAIFNTVLDGSRRIICTYCY